MHLKALGTYTPSLVFSFQTWGADFLVTLMLLHVKHAIETFNISFESTQNRQQYGTKITAQR